MLTQHTMQDDVVLVDRGTTSRRSSSILASNAAIPTILEEDDANSNASKSIEIVDDSLHEKPRPGKRTSFAPDPIHYREARAEHNQEPSTNTNGSSGIMSAMRRLTSVFGASSNFPLDASNFQSLGSGADSRARGRRVRTTIFSRGSTTLSMASSDGDGSDSNLLRDNSCLKQAHYNALRRLIEGRFWRYICYILIFITIFGTQIQWLWIPKSWDMACDVIYTVAVVVLCFDIVFRSIIDPLYFSWRCGSEKRNLLPGQVKHLSWLKRCNFKAGSFVFWCDVIGTLTFLYEIGYINSSNSKPMVQHIVLSPSGIPLSGVRYTADSVDFVLFWVIGRATRMSRFIRTTYIVEKASNSNFIKYFQPYYWSSECSAMKSKFLGENEENRRSSVNSASKSQMNLGSTLRQSTIRRESLFASTTRPDHPAPKERGLFHDLAAAVGISKNDSEDHAHKSANTSMLNSRGASAQSGTKARQRHSKDSSHVGTAMRELTGQRVAVGIFVAFILNGLLTYREPDQTPAMTMILLHGQTRNSKFAERSLNIARSVVPTLFYYERYNETGSIINETYSLDSGRALQDMRMPEILNISVQSHLANTTGLFDNRTYIYGRYLDEFITTIYVLIIWVIAVTAFAGPVMTLVVEPIERMVALLSMLMKDPLGYQNSPQFQILMEEEEEVTPHPNWEKEVLKGMETSFLLNTILRIGSLMQVGFGSAGTEIIRSGLERGRHKDVLFLNKQGSTVSCIFLFCDIRSFTDATECLQEEVFVFTNKIALVVHSICHSYGGSANKNIGDAFLVSWLLDDGPLLLPEEEEDGGLSSYQTDRLYANSNQADKALLSVVKISMALQYDNYFVESMKEETKKRLLKKFSKRKGPLVQMGFGLHAGKAVQGAIGSTRKLDATYISESVERAEFLESSTKKYGVPLLMSEAFHNLLDPTNKYRCRKVDQLLLFNEDEHISDIADVRERIEHGEKMNLYTFDMDVAALWKVDDEDTSTSSSINELRASTSSKRQRNSIRRDTRKSIRYLVPRRSSSNLDSDTGGETHNDKHFAPSKELILPMGPCEYNDRCWLAPDIKAIRRTYVTNGVVYPMFDSGLIAFYGSQWEHAKHCFQTVMAQMDDGPSRYFMKKIDEHNGIPPPDFIGYGVD